MSDKLNSEILDQVVRLRSSGESPSRLLKYIVRECPEDAHIAFTCMKYFRSAFGLSIKQVSPILGWHNGEISDAKIDVFLYDEMSSGKC